ncbi:hypothetical protein CIT31_07865 [Mesorhizobium wenxiniae]|uniref:Uncharacterized protein n=1 Tax=Mesorhizobium wenxiniae TaxID=2014805 RepID=A0A271KLT7_9HYPH|nr:hypothetical protein CIT31_07865 [Mesorhizobium wenxiniae]
MHVEELEDAIRSRYSDWERSERKRPLNNRKGITLSPEAQSAYLQTISISHEDEAQKLTFKYNFVLTSPLTGSRIYSIVYRVEADTSALISVGDWAMHCIPDGATNMVGYDQMPAHAQHISLMRNGA